MYFVVLTTLNGNDIKLTLTLLTWRIWWAPTKASKWQMGFNSVFKGLRNESAWYRISKEGIVVCFKVWNFFARSEGRH
jgi:hypothetical protein